MSLQHLVSLVIQMSTNLMKKFYNILMASLAVISIALIFLDYSHEINITSHPYSYIDNGILIIFAIDYIFRFALAKNKKRFFRGNIFDLLSIIPVNGIFAIFRINRVGRLFRLFKLLRITRLVGLVGRLESFLKINGLLYYLYISLAVLMITASMYCISEKVSFETALWWSITTATTVGYGDVSPSTGIGKITAVVDMLVGIGLIGMLTSSITSFFTKSNDDNEIKDLKEQNQRLEKKLDEIESLLKERKN